MIRRIALALAFCAFLIGYACAQGGMMPGPGTVHSTGGGGSPTWTGQTSVLNGACGFVATCTTTGITVTSGLVVVGIGGQNNGAGATTINSVVLCGTSLTPAVNPSVVANGFFASLFYGTVTGGSCSLVATSILGSLNSIGIALGTLNNLASSTPGGTCGQTFQFSQNSPYPCSSSITILTGGFAIAFYITDTNAALTSSNTTIDSQMTSAAPIAVAIAHSSTAGSITPTFAAANFIIAGTAAAAWQ